MIAAVGPIEDALRRIELEVDGFRELIEQRLDVGAVCRALALRDLYVGAEDTAQASVVPALLCPVDFPEFRVDGDSDSAFPIRVHGLTTFRV